MCEIGKKISNNFSRDVRHRKKSDECRTADRVIMTKWQRWKEWDRGTEGYRLKEISIYREKRGQKFFAFIIYLFIYLYYFLLYSDAYLKVDKIPPKT